MRPITRLASIHGFAVLALLGVGGCGSPEPRQDAAHTVTVYVSTDRVFSEPVLREYEKRTGAKVNAVYDTEETKSTGLANRLLAEKARPQADVFWSNEPVRTLVLKSRDVLASYQSPSAEGSPQRSSILTGTGPGSRRGYASSRTTPRRSRSKMRRSRSSTWRTHSGRAKWPWPIRDLDRRRSTSRPCTP
jgi:hypothetical protein